jgi:hypothetical protein
MHGDIDAEYYCLDKEKFKEVYGEYFDEVNHCSYVKYY